MYIPKLTENDMSQLIDSLNGQLKDKKFSIIHISKSNGTFDIYENNHDFTAKIVTSCRFPNYIEIRYSYGNNQWAAFEIRMPTEILTTNRTVQVTTRPGNINGFRNIIIHL